MAPGDDLGAALEQILGAGLREAAQLPAVREWILEHVSSDDEAEGHDESLIEMEQLATILRKQAAYARGLEIFLKEHRKTFDSSRSTEKVHVNSLLRQATTVAMTLEQVAALLLGDEPPTGVQLEQSVVLPAGYVKLDVLATDSMLREAEIYQRISAVARGLKPASLYDGSDISASLDAILLFIRKQESGARGTKSDLLNAIARFAVMGSGVINLAKAQEYHDHIYGLVKQHTRPLSYMEQQGIVEESDLDDDDYDDED